MAIETGRGQWASTSAGVRTGSLAPGSCCLEVRAVAFRRTIVSDTSTRVRTNRSGLLDEFGRLRAESLATLAAWQLTDAELALDGAYR